ncbi:hypothetical protein IJI00_02955 [Candidatus Saccharibacteria bacterium]|nr:hypothetical protein [Candidatus Saccharibacteria bacterium]
MKNKMAYAGSAMALMFGAGFLAPVGVYADGTISTFEELDSAICAGGSYTLGADIAANAWLGSQCNYVPSKDLTLDFNGHTVTSAEDKGYNLDFHDGTLTFKDSVGGGGYTQLGSGNIAIAITNGKFVLDGGDINSVDWGVVLWHDSEMEMNGGSITTDTDSCISGNGVTDPSNSNYGANTKITINGGKITSKNATGIYHPQMNGVLAIAGGEISGKDAGVEIRAGELNITGGKISSASDVEYSVTANGSGSTISGAAVAVSQHTTKLPLKVVISGGEFSGPVAFSEQNPQQNGAEALAKITTSITNGSFVATGDEPIVVSEDVRNFITGGTYSKAPVDDYVAEGYKAIKTEAGYRVAEVLESGSSVSEDGTEARANFAEPIEGENLAIQIANSEMVEADMAKVSPFLKAVYDINVVNQDTNEIIAVDGNQIDFALVLDAADYEGMQYFKVVYIDDEGKLAEAFDTEVQTDTENGTITLLFSTTHLSAYGVLASDTEFPAVLATESESTGDTVAAPETGIPTAVASTAQIDRMISVIVTSSVVFVAVASVRKLQLMRWARARKMHQA